MSLDKIKLYKPFIEIYLDSKCDEVGKVLVENGFKLTKKENVWIYHGKGYLNEDIYAVFHFYLDVNEEYFSDCMIHPKYYASKSIVESFLNVEEFLRKLYGEPSEIIENPFYGINNSKWKLKKMNIEHFIQDRFGDEEGIYLEFIR